MTSRTGRGQVKFKVRYHALLLKEFTVTDIMRISGLNNRSSVHSELQRMKKEKLVTSSSYSAPLGPKKRGGHPALFRLSEDPKVRWKLAQSVHTYYGTISSHVQPTSGHYRSARNHIKDAISATGLERKLLLGEAAADLQQAYKAEGGDLASETLRSLIQYEFARIAFWRGKFSEAGVRFQVLRKFFTEIGDESRAKLMEEFLLCKEARLLSPLDPPALRTRRFLGTLQANGYQTDSPVTTFSLQLNQQIESQLTESLRLNQQLSRQLSEEKAKRPIQPTRKVISAIIAATVESASLSGQRSIRLVVMKTQEQGTTNYRRYLDWPEIIDERSTDLPLENNLHIDNPGGSCRYTPNPE